MTLTILRERRDLCRELHRLTDEEQCSISQSDYDALIEILAQKRSVVERLLESSPVAREWPKAHASFSVDDRAEGERLLAESRQLLARIAESETHAINALMEQRDSTQRQLSEIASSGQANVAYRDALAPATHRSLDISQ